MLSILELLTLLNSLQVWFLTDVWIYNKVIYSWSLLLGSDMISIAPFVAGAHGGWSRHVTRGAYQLTSVDHYHEQCRYICILVGAYRTRHPQCPIWPQQASPGDCLIGMEPSTLEAYSSREYLVGCQVARFHAWMFLVSCFIYPAYFYAFPLKYLTDCLLHWLYVEMAGCLSGCMFR